MSIFGRIRIKMKRIQNVQEGEKRKIGRELISTILARKPKMSSFLEWQVRSFIAYLFFIRIQLIQVKPEMRIQKKNSRIRLFHWFVGSVSSFRIWIISNQDPVPNYGIPTLHISIWAAEERNLGFRQRCVWHLHVMVTQNTLRAF